MGYGLGHVTGLIIMALGSGAIVFSLCSDRSSLSSSGIFYYGFLTWGFGFILLMVSELWETLRSVRRVMGDGLS